VAFPAFLQDRRERDQLTPLAAALVGSLAVARPTVNAAELRRARARVAGADNDLFRTEKIVLLEKISSPKGGTLRRKSLGSTWKKNVPHHLVSL
jgi:hypothetical protein